MTSMKHGYQIVTEYTTLPLTTTTSPFEYKKDEVHSKTYFYKPDPLEIQAERTLLKEALCNHYPQRIQDITLHESWIRRVYFD